MTNRRTIITTVIAAALLALCLPALVAAQGSYDPYRRDRDRDYRRDRDYGQYGRYDSRYVRDSARRLKDLSEDFQKDLDRALDRSRVDGTRREDNLNELAKDFRRATNDLKNRIGDGRDLNRSRNEAQRVLEIGSRLDRAVQRQLRDNRVSSRWMQIRQELSVIADAYGNRAGYDDGYYRRDDDYRRRRDDDNRRRSGNDPWWRRLPY